MLSLTFVDEGVGSEGGIVWQPPSSERPIKTFQSMGKDDTASQGDPKFTGKACRPVFGHLVADVDRQSRCDAAPSSAPLYAATTCEWPDYEKGHSAKRTLCRGGRRQWQPEKKTHLVSRWGVTNGRIELA